MVIIFVFSLFLREPARWKHYEYAVNGHLQVDRSTRLALLTFLFIIGLSLLTARLYKVQQ